MYRPPSERPRRKPATCPTPLGVGTESPLRAVNGAWALRKRIRTPNSIGRNGLQVGGGDCAAALTHLRPGAIKHAGLSGPAVPALPRAGSRRSNLPCHPFGGSRQRQGQILPHANPTPPATLHHGRHPRHLVCIPRGRGPGSVLKLQFSRRHPDLAPPGPEPGWHPPSRSRARSLPPCGPVPPNG